MGLLIRERRLPRIILHQHLIDLSGRQIASSPHAETGGKFLGYIIRRNSQAPPSNYGREIADVWAELAQHDSYLLLAGSISPGPAAERTAVSLIPDGQFQAMVFRSVEEVEPQVEHLGSWHSHHTNGLHEFSDGDVRNYMSVIADRNYGPDYFVAALCHSGLDLERGLIEIFQRKGIPRTRIANSQVMITSKIPSLQSLIERAEAEILTAPRSPLEIALANEFTIKRRQEDAESLSWIIENPSEPGFLGVVTQVKGPEPLIAVSLEISNENATLRFDGSEMKDVKKLTHKLLDVVNELDKVKRQSQSHDRRR